ncbi:hypothetical protein, partial [Gemmatimonas sp.]|uniref:hypothetical protein n=1 Tax=Gemmatimonas sp. TaxID=1962908 RepID=UPI0037C050EF
MLRFLRVGDASRAVRHAGVLSVLVLTAAASTGAQQPRRPGGQTPRDTTVSIPTGPETAAPLVRTVPVAPAEIPMA